MNKRPTFYDHVCKKYGNVFLDLDYDIRADLNLFIDWARSRPIAASLLKQKSLPQTLAKRVLNLFFKSHTIHTQSKAALCLLIDYRRLSYLPLILSYMTMRKERIVDVFMQSGQKLSEKAAQNIAQSIETTIRKKPRIHTTINPDLFMGTTLVWDCFMIDASLQKLAQSMETEDQKQ
jgi:F0F1-type ATP synthase delta subunit